MTTIGRIYLNLGQLDSAQTILEDTLEIQKVHLPEEDPNYINTLCLLSEAYFQAANYQNALTTLGKVKTILTETGQDVGYSYSKTLLRLAETHAFQGDLQKAEILANEAMALRKEQLGPKCSEVAEALDILSAILEKQGRHQEASNLMLQSKSIRATI
jgi:tetratricopeptide (TPR) repeat protein